MISILHIPNFENTSVLIVSTFIKFCFPQSLEIHGLRHFNTVQDPAHTALVCYCDAAIAG